tara:strand:+ start:21 stop:227 length:207 start_codon:yes stop_codon:yes gene_type:complete
MAPEVGLVPILLFLGWILHCYSTLPQPGSELFFTTRHYHLLAIPLAPLLADQNNFFYFREEIKTGSES